jgi:FAD/FMN-containing dehydrogenase
MDIDIHHHFKNWSKTIQFRPARFCRPESEADVITLVNEARAQGRTLRFQGAGHSFSQILTTNETLATLDEIPVSLTVNGAQATVSAGIRLKRLIPELKKKGLGLRNIGSITEQSIAGAAITGTHGTGIGFGSIATQIEKIRLISADGTPRTIDQTGGDVMEAARLSLGLFGPWTEVTLNCVPYYELEHCIYLTKFDHVLPHIDTLVSENERVLFWWLVPPFGPRDTVIIVTKNPKGHPPGMLGGAQEGLLPWLSTLVRPFGERGGRDLAALAGFTGVPTGGFKRIYRNVAGYEDVLTIPLLPILHRECEYAIPANHTVEALKRMRTVFDEAGTSLLLPVEVRFLGKDSMPLSPARGRDVAYIGASTLDNATEVFERFEPIMKDFDGRPHWGKNFTLTRAEVAKMYGPDFDRFRQIRKTFDPQGVFMNSFLREYFE